MEFQVKDYYPDLNAVRAIDQELKESWGIDFFSNADEHLVRFERYGAKIQKFFSAQQRVSRRIEKGGSSSEKQLMEIMSDVHVNAAIASLRRAYILDGIAMASGIITSKGISGRVLDIGTHVGVIPDILSKFHENEFYGVDPVAVAITTARQRVRQPNAKFAIDRLPSSDLPKADLVLCLDVLSHVDDDLLEKSVGSIAEALNDGGYALVTAISFQEVDWCKLMAVATQKAGLGMECFDMHGGYQDVPPVFSHVPAVVLRKGSDVSVPIDVAQQASQAWSEFFPAYANNPGTPLREKTQAFERAQRS